jgi:DNA-binding MarR family transcriptional regulator
MWAAANPVKVVTRDGGIDDMQSLYPQVLNLIERLHRRLLDVIKDEFDRRGRTDINAVQALLLFNIGDREVMAGELCTRGYYLGSNVSHSLKKLIELGLLDQRRSRSDRRSMRVKLTERGQAVHDIIARLYDKHVRTIEPIGGISADEILRINKALQLLEHFWADQILYQL